MDTGILHHARITATVNDYSGSDFRVTARDGATTGMVRTEVDDTHLLIHVFEDGTGTSTYTVTFNRCDGDTSAWAAAVAVINTALTAALAR